MIPYECMTSENGETYAEPYACDGWVDFLERTLLVTGICFLMQEHNLKKTITWYVV